MFWVGAILGAAPTCFCLSLWPLVPPLLLPTFALRFCSPLLFAVLAHRHCLPLLLFVAATSSRRVCSPLLPATFACCSAYRFYSPVRFATPARRVCRWFLPSTTLICSALRAWPLALWQFWVVLLPVPPTSTSCYCLLLLRAASVYRCCLPFFIAASNLRSADCFRQHSLLTIYLG